MASGFSSSKTVSFAEAVIDEPTQGYNRKDELTGNEGDFVESSSEGELISSDNENYVKQIYMLKRKVLH